MEASQTPPGKNPDAATHTPPAAPVPPAQAPAPASPAIPAQAPVPPAEGQQTTPPGQAAPVAQTAPPQPPVEPAKGPETPQEARDRLLSDASSGKLEGWPQPGHDGPHPWEVSEVYAIAREGETPPAQPDHGYPTLTFGVAGPPVVELVTLLKQAGYANNTVVQGQGVVLDNTVMNDVKRFCADYNVANDPTEYEGRDVPASQLVDAHIGPYIWQALINIAERRRSEGL